MSNIILARKKLREIAEKLKAEGNKKLANELSDIVDNFMRRRKAVRRMPVHSAKVTPSVREKIIELAETTDMHASEIAAELGVNPGRVSEVLQGDR